MAEGVQRKSGESNGLGIAGFVISLVGLCSGGLLSPIGLIISLVALGKEPKGLAIAGVVIGALGSCGIILSLVFLPVVFVGVLIAVGATAAALALAAALGGPDLEAFVEMQILSGFVEKYEDSHGALPPTLVDAVGSGSTNSGLLKDPWGHDYVYVIEPGGNSYKIFCAGPDGVPATADDIQKDGFNWPKSTPSSTTTTPSNEQNPPEAPKAPEAPAAPGAGTGGTGSN